MKVFELLGCAGDPHLLPPILFLYSDGRPIPPGNRHPLDPFTSKTLACYDSVGTQVCQSKNSALQGSHSVRT